MKTLQKLKLHNLEGIGAKEQRSMKGGDGDGVPPGMIAEVVVYGQAPENYYLWGAGGGSIFDGENGFSSGYNGFVSSSEEGAGQIWGVFRGWAGSDVPYDEEETYDCEGSGDPKNLLALSILANSNITLATTHVSAVVDLANAAQNLKDAANGWKVHTSTYSDAKGALTSISQSLLGGINTLALSYKFSISEIAGGDHAANSTHYDGRAIDVNWVNGDHVDIANMTEAQINSFRMAAIAAGATKVFDPYHDPDGSHKNHFHIEW